jgi:hypothetical protein
LSYLHFTLIFCFQVWVFEGDIYIYDTTVFHETGFECNISLYTTSADIRLLAWRQETFWKKPISETALSEQPANWTANSEDLEAADANSSFSGLNR